MHGRFLDGPWVQYDPDADLYWFNTERILEAGYLSGGERRLLTIAASFAEPEQLVSLNNDIPGLDRGALKLVLAAIAHANGSHENSFLVAIEDDGTLVGTDKVPSAYPWPEA